MEKFKLNNSQENAAYAFKNFLNSKEQVMMLKGAAGTGKTTLVKEFLRILGEVGRGCVLMAPTGRAAFIIGSKTEQAASTIHRAIYSLRGIRPAVNGVDDENSDVDLHSRFTLRKNKDTHDTVYIVDEASMVSDTFADNEAFSFGSGRLLNDLMEYAGGRKVVFVGDYAQLPPVGMNFSPALDKSYVEDMFNCEVVEVTLREVLRQAEGSMMLENADRIRESIEKKTFIEFGLRDGNDTEAVDDDLLRPYYAQSETAPDIHSAIITYSNRQALHYNQAIRRHYFGEDAERLQEGDLLMIARNNYAYQHELFNGNIVKVASCAPDDEVESRTVRVKIGADRVESVELKFRKAVIMFNAFGRRVELSVKLLDNFLDEPGSALGGTLARALMVDFERRLPKDIQDNLPRLKRLLRGKAPLSADDSQMNERYLKLLLTDEYYNAVVCKYGYALTCHKAQGGEWKKVFVDMSRFGGTANEDYFRWAYTALTRASEKIRHYRSPDFNYISSLVVEKIQKSDNIRVSTYAESGKDFLTARFERMAQLAAQNSIEVSQDLSCEYQHRVTFTASDGQSATFSLWYNKKGYSNKMTLLKASSEEFAGVGREIIDRSYVPLKVPFKAAGRPFAEKLTSYLKSLFEELDISLLDITQEHYQDVFHVKTDGVAKICLHFTDKGNYTYMKLISSLGEADEKLEAFRKHFV